VRALQYGGGGDDGRLHDLPQLRRFQVRLSVSRPVPVWASLRRADRIRS
jgi:hypothetical protein